MQNLFYLRWSFFYKEWFWSFKVLNNEYDSIEIWYLKNFKKKEANLFRMKILHAQSDLIGIKEKVFAADMFLVTIMIMILSTRGSCMWTQEIFEVSKARKVSDNEQRAALHTVSN